MNYALTEEQELLKSSAREFLAKECPKTLVRAMETDEKGYSPELWKKMADLGWQGLVFPEQYGGSGLDFLDMTILIEEMGRALVPGPFIPTVIECGLPILAEGTDEQKKEFLPRISRGNLIMTLALVEHNSSYDAAGVNLKATAKGGDFVLNGTKMFVPDVHIADYILVAARTRSGKTKEDGITLFLVDAKTEGISFVSLKTMADDKQFELEFEDVKVPGKNVLGKIDGGWAVLEKIKEQSALALCAWMAGGAQQVLEMTVAYAKDRVQFGKPIGTFQAIQHKLANMVGDVDGARFITYHAAWRMSRNMPYSQYASMAKAWTGDAFRRVCLDGHQAHGGIAFTKDHDLQLYLRRQKVAELMFGDAVYHRELIAQKLGL